MVCKEMLTEEKETVVHRVALHGIHLQQRSRLGLVAAVLHRAAIAAAHAGQGIACQYQPCSAHTGADTA